VRNEDNPHRYEMIGSPRPFAVATGLEEVETFVAVVVVSVQVDGREIMWRNYVSM